MAIPAITNNSPSAGRIAWGAFNIQLNGVTYSVPAGSTDKRWVWWQYNGGSPSIQAAAEVPSTLVDDDLVLFANKNGIGVRVQSTSFIDGELLVDGSIFSEALSTNLINSQHIVTAGLDAGVIKFGTMHGDRIQVGTLSSDRVIVGGGDNTRLDESLKSYVQSRGTNLVTNGTGLLGDNTNFKSFTFDRSDAPDGAAGSFVTGATTNIAANELIPIDPNVSTKFSYSLRQTGSSDGARVYGYLMTFDAFKNAIGPQHVMYTPGTLTTLAAPLNPGDTQVTLTSSSNWYGVAGKPAGASNTHLRSFIFWDYVDPGGKLWPELTYSRNYYGNLYADGGITGNVVSLSAPWAGPAKPAGTKLSNGASGGTYLYGGAVNHVIPKTWSNWSAVISGIAQNGVSPAFSTGWPSGASFARIGWLVNRTSAGGYDATSAHAVANVYLGDAQAISDQAASAKARADASFVRWAPENQTTIDGGKITANTIVGNHIMGQTIGAEKLVVGDLANMAEINESRAIGPVFDSTHTITNGWSTRTSNASTYFMFRNNHGPLPFKTGDRIRVAFDAYASAAKTGQLYLWAYGNSSYSQFADSVALTTTAKSFEFEFDVAFDTNLKTSFMIGLNGVDGVNVFLRNVRAYRMNAGELIVDGSIRGDHIQGDTITGNKLMGGTITGREIAAETISASKLIVSDLTNFAVDGYFEDPTMASWDPGTPAHLTRVKPSGLLPYGEVTTATNRNSFFKNLHDFEVQKGDEFYISLEVFAPSTNTDTLRFNPALEVYNADGASQLWRAAEYVDIPPNTDWTRLEAVIPITEDNLAKARFNSYVGQSATANQKLRIRRVQLRKRSNGNLIVDGTITGQQIDANTINADHIDVGTLTGDLFVGELVMGSTIRTANLDENGDVFGAYAEMGPEGIITVDSNGDPVAKFPLEGDDSAYVKAHMDMLSAEVRDNFRMRGTNNSIATEGELTLDAGVTPPTAPPTITEFWDTVQLDKNTAVPPHAASAGYDQGTFALNPSQITSIDWNSYWGCWVVAQQRANGFRLWRFNSSGGLYLNLATSRPWVDDYNSRQDVSVCFNSQHPHDSHMSRSGNDWYVWGKTTTGADAINKIPASWIVDAESRPPKLSFDPVNNQYVLIQSNGGGSGYIFVRRFTLNAGSAFPAPTSRSTTDFPSGSGWGKRINGAVIGPQLTGTGSNWAITTDEYTAFFAYSNTGTQLNTNGNYHQWALSSPCLGSCWTGSQFASIDATGKITLYENWNTTANPTYLYFGASAFDSTSGSGDQSNPHAGQTAGQHETPMGTVVRLTPKRRSKIRVTMPETNDSGGADDPDKWRVYFTRSSLSATPTDKNVYKLVATIGSPTAPTTTVMTADATGTAPPGGIKGQPGAVNNFPSADPARIESAATDSSGDTLIVLRGDGAGRVGPLSWDSSGNTTTDPRKVGEVIQFYGTKAQIPAGFLAMDGSTFSSATYPKLAAHLGSTTLPNMTGRVPRGPGIGEVGKETGGSDLITIPDHTHSIPAASMPLSTNTTTGGTANRLTGGHTHDHGGATTGVRESSASVANVPSYMALWFCIKAV